MKTFHPLSFVSLAAALHACAPGPTTVAPTDDAPAAAVALEDLGEYIGTFDADGKLTIRSANRTVDGTEGQAAQALTTLTRTTDGIALAQTPAMAVTTAAACTALGYTPANSVAFPRCAKITWTDLSTAVSPEWGAGGSSGHEFRRAFLEIAYLDTTYTLATGVTPLNTSGTDGYSGLNNSSPGRWYYGRTARSGAGNSADQASAVIAFSVPAANTTFSFRFHLVADIIRPLHVASVQPDGTWPSATTTTGTEVSTTGLSDTGQYVTWTSSSTLLDASLSTATSVDRVFVRDVTTNVTSVVSQRTSGATTTSASLSPRISNDGRYVIFASDDALDGTATTVRQIWVRDRTKAATASGAFVRISAASGTMGNGASDLPTIVGPDGSNNYHVLFSSTATNLGDSSSALKLFYCYFNGTTCSSMATVSKTTAGATASIEYAGLQTASYTITSDGRYVSFLSRDNVVGTAPATNPATSPLASYRQVYVRDRTGATTTLMSGTVSGTTTLTYTFSTADCFAQAMAIDAAKIAFGCAGGANLVASVGGTSDAGTVHMYGRRIVEPVPSSTGAWTVFTTTASTSAQLNSRPTYSRDGRYFAWDSPDSTLVTGDTNGVNDTVVYDTVTSVASRRLLRVSLAPNNAQITSNAVTGMISGNGQYVVFRMAGNSLNSAFASGVGEHVYIAPTW